MFKKIMAPVDLAHKGDLTKALDCTADLAKHYGAQVVYVGVTMSAPSDVAHNPKEFQETLAAFAKDQATAHGIGATAHAEHCNDTVTDVDNALLRAAEKTGADLVVMASHAPSILDYVWPSNGGKVAEHANCSVMVVRN